MTDSLRGGARTPSPSLRFGAVRRTAAAAPAEEQSFFDYVISAFCCSDRTKALPPAAAMAPAELLVSRRHSSTRVRRAPQVSASGTLMREASRSLSPQAASSGSEDLPVLMAKRRGTSSEDQALLAEIRGLVQQLECRCLKAPRCGGSNGSRTSMSKMIGSRSKERYFAVVADEVEDGDAGNGTSFATMPVVQELRRWQRGRLAYWDDREAFERKKPERGSVELLKIAKLSVSPDGPTVTIKHKHEQTFYELVLTFTVKKEAETWKGHLWDLITRVREWSPRPLSQGHERK